jgi:N utilization substance protein A
VVRELNGEKIDIVHWSADAEIYVKRAMSPVTPLLVVVDEDSRTATVVVADDQIQFALGKRGQNIRLASEITGYKIEPIKESEYLSPDALTVQEIPEFDDDTKAKLAEAGFENAEEILDAGEERLREIEGFDDEKVRHILDVLDSYFAEEAEDESDEEPEHEPETSDSDSGK